MQKEEYGKWLEGKLTPKSIKDRLSRCKSVETALGVDLDTEYDLDHGKSVLIKMEYGPKDAREGKKIPDGFSFKEGVSAIQRLTDLRSAVNNYFKYKENSVNDPNN